MSDFLLYLDDDLIKTYKYKRCLLKYVLKLKRLALDREKIDLTFKVIDPCGQVYFV